MSMSNFYEFEKEIERREAYEVRPATIGEIENLPRNVKDDEMLKRCVVYCFTLKATNESRTIIASRSVNPMKLDADDLDILWAKFEPKH